MAGSGCAAGRVGFDNWLGLDRDRRLELQVVNRSKLFLKLSITAFLISIILGIGGITIADLGELVHFNCRPHPGKVICELTNEPLIGTLNTLYLAKSDLIKTNVQTESSVYGDPVARLALITKAHGEIPFTRHGSKTANAQLFAQRDQIDRFITTPQAKILSARTHRPWQLWAFLVGLGIVSGTFGRMLWLSKS